MRRAIVGVTPMSPAAIRGAILIAGQSILLIGDSLDPFAAHDVCASLRGRGHQVFVLDAGDRAWRAQGKAQSASLSVRDAELSIESAALWLEDSATRWISDDGAKHAPRIPTEAIMRTIYFRDDSTSSAQLRSRLESSMAFDERSWWVDATQKELEHYAEQGRSVAASRNVSLAKPCGVN
ncbi:MAG: hypothetical protein EAZ21_15805 [Betaproteobacteria bacterium]|nr:MAG: hypothetical protein EAZ21_15805 [Betaproteobacteria bacterium]